MRFDIRYRTTFTYEQPVRESQNELRACPAADDRQQLVHYRVATAPSSRVLSFTDYWGTRVDSFGVRPPHTALDIVAEATVDTQAVPPLTASPRIEGLADPDFREEHLEYLAPSPHVEWGEAVTADAGRRVASEGDDLVSVVLSLYRATGTTLRYTPGATYVGVTVDEVLQRREGVCQDFAHVAIALCRSVGIPARYVSGYLFTADDATGAESGTDVVEVQTHAWIEVALPGAGWWPLDPTNQQAVGQRHVKIGHGRDYDDVPPLRGTFSGPPEHSLDVVVEIRRTSQHAQQQ